MAATSTHFDLIVIGSGAAGAACWFAARQLGKSVAVFEENALGGECANFACVPTKALLHAAEVFEATQSAPRFGIDSDANGFDYRRIKAWKDEVVSQTGAALGTRPYEDAGVTLVQQRARFAGPDAIEAGGARYTAEQFLIATGAREAAPPIEGLADAGFFTFREAIDLTEAPASVFILGGGAVGCEFGQLFSSFGAEVYLSDRNSRLVHKEDPEAGEALARVLAERGVQLLLGSNVRRVVRDGARRRVTFEDEAGRLQDVLVEHVLVAAGKSPNTDLGLEVAGVAYDKRGIEVDEHLRTANPRVFAAGDVTGPFRFTHAASYQGNIACANMFTEHKVAVDYRAMPRCVFTSPELCAVGLTEEQAREKHGDVLIGRSEIIDNDRGLTSDQRAGFVKVVCAPDGTLLGGVMVGARAGEVMHELALAVKLGARASDVAGLVHAFPTFSEALGAACGNVREAESLAR
jgi:pyruvate/2-oxoglutarate dehydrogenase complex dihydrolipoamide dehydrogenase (E3) component